MEIVSKPYGYYESEKITSSNPPGMSLIGNDKYGEWKTKSNPETGSEDRYWGFNDNYMMFMIYSSGGYNERSYNNYKKTRKSRRSYYGSKSKKYGTWSKRNAKSSSKYVSKTRSKRTQRVGNSRSKTSRVTRSKSSSGGKSKSVRGAGRSFRGRSYSGGGK